MPPIFLGALGPQMTRLAAESADGLLVMPFNTRRHFQERTLPMVDEGLARAGRRPSDLDLVGEVIACCGRTEEELAVADEGTRLASQLLRLDPVISARPGRRGLGRSAIGIAYLVQGRPLGRDGATHRAGHARRAGGPRTPRKVAADIKGRFGDRVDRICV